MATRIKMENLKTGECVDGFYGYSWTSLFFGFLPALFRKDFITFIGYFVIWAILATFTLGVGSLLVTLAWSFIYNKYYTTNLLKKGFAFAGNHTENEIAAGRIGVKLNSQNCLTVS
ncbi:hypothetical protein PCO86_12780 [Pectobacteriaceae bacterium CE70]|uniref:hypothetical protein n=1 Tax=Brenneria uluponensis TaxID=3057057 RepID=UPI0028EE0707|nr:hypothetical protein [Brenneria ulupoensis]WJV64361.1 hypothetical protein PCO87_10270 [Pectobacteriaceae bacterium C52]WJV65207.1 hypothetical protein PCO86_12780 [Pectobacteriaceae bacterium CE70]WJY09221.1 hypothetical protein PCO80_12655 [Pectobacteriaceae bacterium C80]